jgi:hypothetical protein
VSTSGEERPLNQSTGNAASRVSQPAWEPAPRSLASESLVEDVLRSGIPDGQYLAVAAGERLEMCEGLHLAERARQAIFVGCGEMVVIDHVHSHHNRHFRLPSAAGDASRPVVASVVVSVIHQKPIGWKSLGTHLLFFLGNDNRLLGCLDNSVDYGSNSSGTWEFNTEELKALCRSVGVSFHVEVFDTAQEFLDKRPEWTPPELEFEVDHLPTERVREWGLALAIGLPIAVGIGVAGSFLILVGPVGWFVGALEVVGTVVAVVLTVWGHSKWRMKRSLRKRDIASLS